MSFQDRLGQQDAMQLLSIATGLSLATSASNPRWSYNLPVLLFGVVAHEMQSSTEPLRQFISLAGFSCIFDLLNIFGGGSGGLTTIFALLVLGLKVPIIMTCLGVLRERGGQAGFGGFRGLPSMPQMGGGGEGGARSWMPSMPGGTSAPPQYNNQPNQSTQTSAPAAPGSFPSSGGFRLGGDDDETPNQGGGPPQAPQPGRNGYSSIA